MRKKSQLLYWEQCFHTHSDARNLSFLQPMFLCLEGPNNIHKYMRPSYVDSVLLACCVTAYNSPHYYYSHSSAINFLTCAIIS